MNRCFRRNTLGAILGVALALVVTPALALQLTQLTFGAPPPYEAYQAEPAWSPDGAWLAFTGNYWQPGQFEPYLAIGIITSSGGAGPSFNPPVWLPSHPTWSPDGARIAFSANGLEVALIADDQMTEQLYLQNAMNPVWSPTTDQLAFESNGQMMLLASSGGAATPLPTIGGKRPAWSADGSKLAYDAGGRIWVLDLVAMTTVPITSGSATDQHPTWSPDGSWIAFTSRRSGSAALWIVAATGGGVPIQLTTSTTDDYDPAWSPDGDTIAFTSGRGGAGPHVWLATDLPDFTVAVQPTTWSGVKGMYR